MAPIRRDGKAIRICSLQFGSCGSWVTAGLVATLAALLWAVSIDVTSSHHEPQLQTIIVSYDPLIIYLENFLSPKETNYLRNLAEGNYHRSQVTDGNGINTESAGRTSSTAVLPRSDAVVLSVISRAARFQGFLPTSNFENLQATSYTTGGEFAPHYDLLSTKAAHNGNKSSEVKPAETERITTIFAILDDSCEEKCGTEFSRIRVNWGAEDKEWCKYVDCDAERLTIRPKAGNAIFWKNLRENGSLHENSLHAGLPLFKGTKVGINIWARTGQYIDNV
ncbi:hypothetical protein LZ30DRAFT_639137 [Colletotrichum cereale]|nr:hypothetical protein LZ30DRAFT_639137 [Colletotrichum cereale]